MTRPLTVDYRYSYPWGACTWNTTQLSIFVLYGSAERGRLREDKKRKRELEERRLEEEDERRKNSSSLSEKKEEQEPVAVPNSTGKEEAEEAAETETPASGTEVPAREVRACSRMAFRGARALVSNFCTSTRIPPPLKEATSAAVRCSTVGIIKVQGSAELESWS